MRIFAMAVFIAVVPTGSIAFGADGLDRTLPPSLTLPDSGTVRGPRAFGPDGPLPLPGDAMPPRPTAAPEAAISPEPVDPEASRKTRLDDLYTRLAHAADPIEAAAIAAMITQSLAHSGSDTADLLMSRAVSAMDGKNHDTAIALLDKLVTLQPHWAEAWNKRATVRYLDDDDDVGAMADIGQVLALEPRHFGALSGMGLILHRNGDDKDALTVLQRAAAVNPQDTQVQQMIEELKPVVRGQDL